MMLAARQIRRKDNAVEALRTAELAKYDLSYFRGEYWKEDLLGVSGNGGRSYEDPDHRDRFALLAAALTEACNFGNLLDVGCGPGFLLRALTATDARLSGIDASTAALALAGNVVPPGRADLRRALCTQLPFEDASFDAVVCLDVLEHLLVFDIEVAVAELVRVTRKHLILSINSDNPYAYHPTILSPATWRAMLASYPNLGVDYQAEALFAERVLSQRDEYAFYCYSVR